MYPIMLPGPNTSNDGFSSFRNPDDLFPERQGMPPDRLGWLFVRFLEALSDGWDTVRGRRQVPKLGVNVDAAPVPGSPELRSH